MPWIVWDILHILKSGSLSLHMQILCKFLKNHQFTESSFKSWTQLCQVVTNVDCINVDQVKNRISHMAGNIDVSPYCELHKLIVDSTTYFYHFSVGQAPVAFFAFRIIGTWW